MPCDDVTELLRLRLDSDDRVVGYQLRKRTCGKAVGEESLLAAEVAGESATSILVIDLDEFVEQTDSDDDAVVYLRLKHLFAIQSGLRVLLGHEPGGVNEPVRVAGVTYDGDEVVLNAEISVDILTEQIESCGKCKGCARLISTDKHS